MMRKSDKPFFVHPSGICESSHVGKGTAIWAFTHVLKGAKIGCHVNLNDHVFVENDVVVGDRVTVKCFVALWDGLSVEDDVFIGPNAVFANDKYVRSKMHLKKYPRTIIRKGASIGGGAVILPGVEIGSYAMVAAGALISKDVAPFELVIGVPARHAGFVCRCGHPIMRAKNKWRCARSGWTGKRLSRGMRCVR